MAGDRSDLVREAVRAFNDQDVDALATAADPDIVIELVGGFSGLMGTRFEGVDGARRFFEDWFGIFPTMHLEVERFVERGDRVVVLTRMTAAVPGSEQPVELAGGAIYDFEGDQFRHLTLYYERAALFEAAGLEG